MRGSRRQIHFHSAHGSGRMAVKYCTELLPGPIMIDYTDYRGQFRAGEPDGRGRMRVNADVFEGTFYPSLSYGEYLIPFVGTRTLADGSTQDGTFILARGCCYKITDVCFESGFIMMSRYCLRVKLSVVRTTPFSSTPPGRFFGRRCTVPLIEKCCRSVQA